MKNKAKTNGGGIYNYDTTGLTTLEIMNCTIVSNEASSLGGGVFGHNIRIVNSIIWGNIPDQIRDAGVAPFPYIEYSDVQDWATDVSSNVLTGPGTIEVYPDFQTFPNDPLDLHLTGDTSTEITQGGTKEGAPDEDFDGNPRTEPYSMGAYEKD